MRSSSEILTSVLAPGQDPDTLLGRLCQACADDLPITGAGLALMNDDGHQGVLAATDGPAALMEELQFTLGEGPCVDASLHGRPVLQPDLASTAVRHWPGFGPEVLAAGIAAIFAFPLQLGAIRIGILDLYRDAPGSLEGDVLAGALAYADASVLLLLHLQGEMAPGEGLHPQLSHPLDNRAEVHQATGVVSVHAVVSMTEALLLLRAHAYSVDRPILQIARAVIAGTLRIHPLRNDDE
jgi:hypothetical protein